MWRPEFEHLERRRARLRGYARRFWQGSTDHRGVPDAPGRVVTLIVDPAATTAGMAYRVSDAVWASVVTALDDREKGGYERHTVELDGVDGVVLPALIYVASPDNAKYLGPADTSVIVEQIDRCRGPSGPNDEYLLRLEHWLLEHGEHDAHVFELADLLRSRRRQRPGTGATPSPVIGPQPESWRR